MSFPAYPKTPRWDSEITITEKIDGTNGLISIEAYDPYDLGLWAPDDAIRVHRYDGRFLVRAGSRKRRLSEGKRADNFGFRAWVWQHASSLVDLLGPGLHYGEWYGRGIQRGYGLDDRRFALFNPFHEFTDDRAEKIGLEVVPLLYHNIMDPGAIAFHTEQLRYLGSCINRQPESPRGTQPAEGIIITWTKAPGRPRFKVVWDK